MLDYLVDTHTHYAHKRFNCGRDEILHGLKRDKIIVIESAIEFNSNKRMEVLCEKYSNVYMATGCHPNCVLELDDEKMKAICDLTKNRKVIAIGETGLDYVRAKTEELIQTQKVYFKKFISMSIKVNKPLVIHCRGEAAYEDLFEILDSYNLPNCPGVVHCFSGDKKQAEQLLEMGFFIGVNGMFTKLPSDSAVCSALKTIPIDRILLETDSPYLVPSGISGKRNTSLNLEYIINRLAKLRNEKEDYIREVTIENTKIIYPEIFLG